MWKHSILTICLTVILATSSIAALAVLKDNEIRDDQRTVFKQASAKMSGLKDNTKTLADPVSPLLNSPEENYKSLTEPAPARYTGSKDPLLAKVIPFKDSDYNWNFIKEKKDHRIYVSETPWSRYRTFKAETVIEQPIEVLMEVMLDVDGFAAWLPDCLQSRHLKTLGKDKFEGHFLVHVIWDSIWPITNRDFVIEVVTHLDWKTMIVTVELISVDDSDVPVAKGTKRLKKFYSRYQYSTVDRNHTHVTYSMIVDPDLPFPSRIAEIQTSPIPYKTLVGLAKRAKEPVFRQWAVQELF
ncbi:MAG: START domain-containing protein [Desulfobacteraceae bacterium]|jgi:hypothetical protein